MGKYSPEEVQILSTSPYIDSVSERSVLYGDVFKQEFYLLTKQGHQPKEIFRSLGIDPLIVGDNAIRVFTQKMKHYQPKLNEEGDMIALSLSYVDLKKENEKLKFENKFLKKKRLIDLGMYPKEKSNDSTLK
ncbi:hypothetical protein HW423_05275 [Aerococcaceae bacterium INB8]|uniref:Uncharacterized protein n=1 Tax=Ruoffia halotolerans TaxID=2748684 RepID=A0A839A674_9LACT|nr:HTH domain-containing protein [Ruoffia halotolerans]MBA5729193.1 hypothetical protein [Ruoffia halotolerans]